MKKILLNNNRISREFLTNPYSSHNYKKRLKKSKVINLKDNSFIKDHKNDYCKIIPIDDKKLF